VYIRCDEINGVLAVGEIAPSKPVEDVRCEHELPVGLQ